MRFGLLTLLLLIENIFAEINDNNNAQKKPKAKQLILNDSAFCENLLNAFYVSDNSDVVANATYVAQNVTENDCLNFCLNNRNQKGRLVFCGSVTYDQQLNECKIYKQSSFPDGTLKHKTQTGKRYFEKFCLAEDLPTDCANKQFVRVNDYILKGYAQSTVTVSSMAECVAQCVRETEFECKSAMYFYEEGECITNLESAITRPDDFQKPDDGDKVVFFHNGCINQLEKIENTSSRMEISASEDDQTIKNTQEEKIKDFESNSTKATNSSENLTIEIPVETTTLIDTISTETSLTTIPDNNTTPKKSEEIVLINSQKEPLKLEGKMTQNQSEIVTSKLPEEITEQPKIQNEINMTNELSNNFKHSKTKDDDKVQEDFENIREEIKEEENHEELKEKMLKELEKEKLQKTEIKIEKLEGNFQAEQPKIPEEKKLEPEILEKKIIQTSKLHAANFEKGNDGIFLMESVETEAPEVKVPKMIEEIKIPEENANSQSLNNSPEATSETNLDLLKRPKFLSSVFTKRLQLKPIKTSRDKEVAETENWSDNGFFDKWAPWTPCKQAGERRIRRRRCLDLRRCKGALMQVDYCPNILPDNVAEESQINEQSGPTGPPTRDPLPVVLDGTQSNGFSKTGGAPPSILPPQLPKKELKPLPIGAPGRPQDIWSPWLGVCNHFATAQSCTNNQVIGFESRECIAKDPKLCKGPFFKYCTLPC